MDYKRYCPICQVERTINIWEAYNKNMQRIICGYCCTVLIKNRSEIEAIWWNFFGCDS